MSCYYEHNIDPFLIKFPKWSPIGGIRWYGICYLVSFIVAYFLLNLYSKKSKSTLTREQNDLFLTYCIIGVIAGGRIGFVVLYDLYNFLSNPFIVFKIWQGGMSSHGGFIGVALAIYMFCKKNKTSFLRMTDMCATIAPIGFFLGRIGNFINCELYGKITNSHWGVIFDKEIYFLSIPRHPSQFYEGTLEGLFIFIYMQIRLWGKKADISIGKLTGEFLILYSMARIFCEIFREPDASLIYGITRGQFYSIWLFALGLFIIFFSERHKDN